VRLSNVQRVNIPLASTASETRVKESSGDGRLHRLTSNFRMDNFTEQIARSAAEAVAFCESRDGFKMDYSESSLAIVEDMLAEVAAFAAEIMCWRSGDGSSAVGMCGIPSATNPCSWSVSRPIGSRSWRGTRCGVVLQGKWLTISPFTTRGSRSARDGLLPALMSCSCRRPVLPLLNPRGYEWTRLFRDDHGCAELASASGA
jgi:hypothetical protein